MCEPDRRVAGSSARPGGADAGQARGRLRRITEQSPGTPVASYSCDFARLDDVRRLAGQLLDACERIDVLVDNAGTVFDKRTLTADGHESTFAVNHLAPFLLTELLLDRIVASAPARIVITSSTGHYAGTMDFGDLGFERGYSIMRAYSRSKLANALYTRHLARRLDGTGVTANCLHPGTVATRIWSGAPWYARPVLAVAKRVGMISPAEGGRTLTHLATDPALEGSTGLYFDRLRPKRPSDVALDDAVADRLDDESRRLVGLGR
ncbi:MAG: SDR family NAD(P)-dependent oxidoreductase [Nocardioides sp.]